MATLTVLLIWGFLVFILYFPQRRNRQAVVAAQESRPTQKSRSSKEQIAENYSWKYVPESRETQKKLLSALRRAFLLVELDDYQQLLLKCCCPVSEISKRHEFYQELARMLIRHLRFAPAISQYLTVKEIAMEMSGSGILSLQTVSQELIEQFQKMEKWLLAHKTPIRIEEAPAISSFPEYFPEIQDTVNDLKDWIHELEETWKFGGRLDAYSAYLYEALEEVEIAELKFSLSNLQILSKFFFDLEKLLKSIEAPDWGKFVAEKKDRWLPGVSLIWMDLFRIVDTPGNAADRTHLGIKILEEKEFGYQEIEQVFLLFSKDPGVPDVGKILLEKVRSDPGNVRALKILGEWYLFSNRILQAVVLLTWSFKKFPREAEFIWGLARAYHRLYFHKQVDICLRKLQELDSSLPEAKRSSRKLYAEVCLRSAAADVQVEFNGKNIGVCPVNLQRVPEGTHEFVWRPPDGNPVIDKIEVKDGWLYRLNFSLERKVAEEITRDGVMTLLSENEVEKLKVLMKEYLISDLNRLPVKTFDEIFQLYLDERRS